MIEDIVLFKMLYHLVNQDEIEIKMTRGRVVVDICSIGGTPAPRLRQKKSWVSYLPPLSGCWVTCKTPRPRREQEGRRIFWQEEPGELEVQGGDE